MRAWCAGAAPSVGASLRHLDVQVLCKALSRMLAHEWEDGYLIYQRVVDGAEPARVAAEQGVSRATLVEQLRHAVGSLACQYEHLAYGHLNEWPAISLRPALVGKRAPGHHSSQRHGTEDPHHKDQGHADPYHP
jgi:hypothetical protein